MKLLKDDSHPLMVLSELFDSGLDVDSLHCTGQCIMMCNDV